MAKKTSGKKKASTKATAKKPAAKKSVAKKSAAKKAGAKKSAASKPAAKKASRGAAGNGRRSGSGSGGGGRGYAPGGPYTVSTGMGAGPNEIGQSLVSMFNAGQWKEVEDKWWSPDVVSVEGMGMAWAGQKAIHEKNDDWASKNTVHGASAEGPFVGASGFAVKFKIDVADKQTGARNVMEEIGVYTVENGKIVREEFMYGSLTPISA